LWRHRAREWNDALERQNVREVAEVAAENVAENGNKGGGRDGNIETEMVMENVEEMAIREVGGMAI